MKMKVQISELTHDDLVNLFSTATYGSAWFGIRRPKGSYKGTNLEDEDDCLEDSWAKVILSGGNLYALDWNAEDEDDFYGKLPHEWNKNKERMRYTFNLKDVIQGLERASESEEEYIRKAFYDSISDNGEFDLTDAETLMQMVIFGEVIYG